MKVLVKKFLELVIFTISVILIFSNFKVQIHMVKWMGEALEVQICTRALNLHIKTN